MKPKTIDEILLCLHLRPSQIARGKQQLLDLFMSCVPEKQDWHNKYMQAVKDGKIPPGRIDAAHGLNCIGWNDCRDQMINNLEKLK